MLSLAALAPKRFQTVINCRLPRRCAFPRVRFTPLRALLLVIASPIPKIAEPRQLAINAPMLRALAWLAALLLGLGLGQAPALADVSTLLPQAPPLRSEFQREVNRRLQVPEAAQRRYAQTLDRALQTAKVGDLANGYVVLVDRNPHVQALLIYWRASSRGSWQFVGASPVSTGMPGSFEHFITPVGVFRHTPDNMDYRAEGTRNGNGIRGYGRRGMRIYDFGWQQAKRGWGKPAFSTMRFQMHATDPDRLEILLGERHSKGCVRIPATLNTFIDMHGLLDADYEARQDAQIVEARQAKKAKQEAKQAASSAAAASSGSMAGVAGRSGAASAASAASATGMASSAGSASAARMASASGSAGSTSAVSATSAASATNAASAASAAAAMARVLAQPKIPVLNDAPRNPIKDAGRFLVVVDSQTVKRPGWSPDPKRHGRQYRDAARNDTAD